MRESDSIKCFVLRISSSAPLEQDNANEDYQTDFCGMKKDELEWRGNKLSISVRPLENKIF